MNNNVEVVRIDVGSKTTRINVIYKNKKYIISCNSKMGETLIFRANSEWGIDDYLEVGGARGVTYKEVVDSFEEYAWGIQ